MSGSPYRAALIQMTVIGGDLEGNLTRAESGIAQAAAGGARLAVLPETLDIGWTHPACRDFAGGVPGGHAVARLCAAAALHGLHVCAGLTERDGDRVFNAAILIDPAGTILLKHRKINELSIAHGCYELGDRLNVVDTELGRIGLMICADAFAEGQVLSRALGCMGAHVILSPAAWAVPADHDQIRAPYGDLWREHYIPVAREYGMWIIGVSNVGPIIGGPWGGRQCIGCSLVIDADGNEVLQGPYGASANSILLVDVSLPGRKRPTRDL